jgi:hypothetical protein
MTHLLVFGSKWGSSQSSAGTQVPVLPSLEQAGTNIFFSPHAPAQVFWLAWEYWHDEEEHQVSLF